jgi:hypothetical protein
VISRVAAYLQGEAKAAIRYERPALAPVEQVTERCIVVLNERLKANRRREAKRSYIGIAYARLD